MFPQRVRISPGQMQRTVYSLPKRMTYAMMQEFAGAHLVFLYKSSSDSCLSLFCSLSLCSILSCTVSLLLSECLCFRRTDTYCRALAAIHSHLAKRKMVYALSSCQEAAIGVSEVQSPCSFNRLTSDFRNNLSGFLLQLCLSSSFALKVPLAQVSLRRLSCSQENNTLVFSAKSDSVTKMI